MTDHELELALRGLGARLAAELQRDLVPAVTAALAHPAPRRAARPLRVLLVAAALLLVAAGGALAAAGGLRADVVAWLRGAGVELRAIDVPAPALRTTPLPAATTGPAAPPVVAATLPELGLGARVPARTAAAAVGALPELPGLGAPAAVLLAEPAAGPVATLVWPPGPGLPAAPDVPAVGALLTVAPLRDDLDPFILAKLAPPGLVAEVVDLGDVGDGVYIGGVPHLVALEGLPDVRFRLAANMLLWRRGAQVLRLESALGKDALAALARAAR